MTSDASERVILVDEHDREVGTGPKLETHLQGTLHRAFSIFLFDEQGRTLIQKRADGKYHSGGKWANTCCGHPRPDEPVHRAAHRRLTEELGIAAELKPGFLSRYRAELDAGMIENEFVHVFYGVAAGEVEPDPDEVSDVKFVGLAALKAGDDVPLDGQTAWLRHYIDQHFDELLNIQGEAAGQFAAIDKRVEQTEIMRKFV